MNSTTRSLTSQTDAAIKQDAATGKRVERERRVDWRGWRAQSALAILALATLLAVWWIATDLYELVPTYRFPDPATFGEAAVQVSTVGYAGGTLLKHVGTSSLLVLKGFLISVVVGLTLGLTMSLSEIWKAFFLPIFNLVRPVPPLAWIPLALLWFGLGSGSKLFVMCFAAVIPIVINTMTGVNQIDPVLLAAGRVHGARGWFWVRNVIFPGALGHILIGTRLALQTCWTVIVAAELLGAFWGVGKVLSTAQEDVNSGMVLVGMVTVTVLGFLSSQLLRLVEWRLMPWTR
ncbi:taurine transport system permease protein [Nitrobacteraceae bacterium AZCC 1564]